MIPAKMSREALEAFVKRNCIRCKKNCPPFKRGEYYPADPGIPCIDETLTVWVDAEFSEAVYFTPEEGNEYFGDDKEKPDLVGVWIDNDLHWQEN